MCGVQAQLMSSAELQFAARIDGLSPDDVGQGLWERRSLVKTWAMRGTLHLFSAEDFPLYAAALRTRDHWRKPAWLRGHGHKPFEHHGEDHQHRNLHENEVKLGERSGDAVEIVEGLHDHQQVAVPVKEELREGAPVEAVP